MTKPTERETNSARLKRILADTGHSHGGEIPTHDMRFVVRVLSEICEAEKEGK